MHKRATLMMGNGWRVPRVRKLQPVGRHKKTLRGSQIKLADELALKPIPQPQTFYANEAWNVKDTQKQGVKISVDQKQSSPFQEEQKEKKPDRNDVDKQARTASSSEFGVWGQIWITHAGLGPIMWGCRLKMWTSEKQGLSLNDFRMVPLPHLESQREADCKGGTITPFFHLRKKRAVPALLESAWLASWGFTVITSWPDAHS